VWRLAVWFYVGLWVCDVKVVLCWPRSPTCMVTSLVFKLQNLSLGG